MSQELEDRFFRFAKNVRDFCLKLKWNTINREYIRQLIRSSGSVGANYIEASDDLGKLDEKLKINFQKRSKESVHWLGLVLCYDDKQIIKEQQGLIDEGVQITKILSSILIKLNKT